MWLGVSSKVSVVEVIKPPLSLSTAGIRVFWRCFHHFWRGKKVQLTHVSPHHAGGCMNGIRSWSPSKLCLRRLILWCHDYFRSWGITAWYFSRWARSKLLFFNFLLSHQNRGNSYTRVSFVLRNRPAKSATEHLEGLHPIDLHPKWGSSKSLSSCFTVWTICSAWSLLWGYFGELLMSIVGGEIHELLECVLRAVVSVYYLRYSTPRKDTFQVGDHSCWRSWVQLNYFRISKKNSPLPPSSGGSGTAKGWCTPSSMGSPEYL